MADNNSPAMSVIVVASTDSECLRQTLECLEAQSMAPEIECILVTRTGGGLDGAGNATRGLHSVRIIEQDALDDAGGAKASGVRAARAPLVAFVEDHSYPDTGWAEALLKAYERAPLAAVGPVVLNANPVTSASWGCFLVYYGMYMQSHHEEPVKHLPGNQSSYRKAVLLKYGDRLPNMLQAEIVLQAEMVASGMRLWQEPTAKVYHLNYSRIAPAVREYYLASRVFAGERRRRWSLIRRAVYACGSPLLPFIRLKRILGQAWRAGLAPQVAGGAVWPALLILCAGAAGEFLGYWLGPAGAKAALMRFERAHASLFSRDDLEEVRRRGFPQANTVRGRGCSGE